MGFRFAGDIWKGITDGLAWAGQPLVDVSRGELWGQADVVAANRGLPPIGSVAEGGRWIPAGGSVTIDGKVWTNPSQYGERYLTPADESGNRRITWGGQGPGSPRAKSGMGTIEDQQKKEAERAAAEKRDVTLMNKWESINRENRGFEAGQRQLDRDAAGNLLDRRIAGERELQGSVNQTSLATTRLTTEASTRNTEISAGAQNYATDATKEIEGSKLGLLRDQLLINDKNADDDRAQSRYFFDTGLQAKLAETEKDRRQDMLKWGLASLANGFAMLGGY